MPPSGPTDGSVVTGCTVWTFQPYSGMCFTILATRGLPRTMVTCSVSLAMDAVHVDVTAHPSDPGMMAWFTTATGDDLDDTLERAAQLALMEFCEHHLSGLARTAIALFLIQNNGNTGWAFMARYA
jgi:hypothetical protein